MSKTQPWATSDRIRAARLSDRRYPSPGDKLGLERFRLGIGELQTSQPLVCSHVATAFA